MPHRTAAANAQTPPIPGMIEGALQHLDGALARLRGMTEDVQRVADKHLGPIPTGETGVGSPGNPIAGTVHALGNLSIELSTALEHHADQLARLQVL